MNALELRRRTLGKGVYKKTVEGNPAIAQGSLARRYPGIGMQGWTEQAQYEGNQLFDASSAVDGIISNGEVVENGSFVTSDFISVIAGNVYSRSETGAGENFFYNADKTYLQNVTGTVNIEAPEGAAYVRFCINKNDFDIQDIMLNEGSTVLPYEPYTGGQPSPNPDYPQEIVSAGNYDEETGKYQYTIKISDSEESPTKSQTVTLTADRPLTKWDRLEKRNGQWGWVYKSAEIVLDGSERWYTNNTLGGYIAYCTNTGLENGEFYISNFQESRQPNAMMDNSVYFYSEYFGFNVMAIRYDSAIDLNQFKNFLGQNSITLVAQTAKETFVPLSESEQELMNELYTFRPTTVLSNDCGCNMTLTYKTKKSLEVAT